jgi:flagellar biosynthesis protein FlhA
MTQASHPWLRSSWTRLLADYAALVVPVAIVLLMIVIVLPLPPLLMDLLIAANLALSVVVLLTTVYIRSPLEFSVFPSLLLAVTLYRVVLNVASTRLILTADADSPAVAGAVAGRVIESFGGFVAGGSVIVGAVLFLILIVVQFVVVTKGATRISEVAARFALDGMPGKQMAIDADLNAGAIDEGEARRRREQIAREADFYGAMDGASKFVRGDAIAGVVITAINIVGGFAIGVFQKGWPAGQTLEVFTRLTIGDGLVSQVPAFIVALAAGLIVTRSGSRADLSRQFTGQLGGHPVALAVAAVLMAALALTGLPPGPMLLIAGGLGVAAYFRRQRLQQPAPAPASGSASEGPAIEKLLTVDALEIEVGYGLIKMVDASHGGDLLDRIAAMRRSLAVELGLVVPPVRVHDNIESPPHEYQIRLRGQVVAGAALQPSRWLAIDTGAVDPAAPRPEGEATREPAMGLAAWWVDGQQRLTAQAAGYTLVDSAGVLIAHLTEVVKSHAPELLNREETNRLIAQLRDKAPKLVEEVIGPLIKPGELQKVLQNLLGERVPIRDLETIVETIGDWSGRTRDPQLLTEYVRNALRRTICAQYSTADPQTGRRRVYCITVDPTLEELVQDYLERSPAGASMTMPPGLSNRVTTAILVELQKLISAGRHPVVLASPQVRSVLRSLLETHLPGIAVLAYHEIGRDVEVQSLGLARVQPMEVRDEPAAAGGRLQGALN